MPDLSFFHRHHEITRKIVHVGFAVAFIFVYALFGAVFVFWSSLIIGLVLFLWRTTPLYGYMHSKIRDLYDVGRQSWGEVFYATGIAITSQLTANFTEFTLIILIVALADTAASLVGKAIRSPRFQFFDASASFAGSSAFFVVALTIIFFMFAIGVIDINFAYAVLVALILTGIEAIAPNGSDNALIPLIACLLILGG